MKKLTLLFASIFLLVSAQGYSQMPESELTGLAKIKSGAQSKRISSYDRSGGNDDRYANIQPGEELVMADIDGAGIINHIWITIAPPPHDLSRNNIILKMYWDGEEEPSVLSPIGPFFGQGWEEEYAWSSLPLAAGPSGGKALTSYFAMPFSENAKIVIENQNDRPIDAFYYYVDYVDLEELPEDMGRFHAWYNKELTEALEDGENEWGVLGPQEENPDGKENYLIADIKGKGQFVGVNYFVDNPSPMWYGEGDDMIFIDDEVTLHGTGTEDYFNTSWAPKILFSHPYFGYGRVNDESGWLGRTHAFRFHIQDPLYFNESLKFTIEHGHNNCLTLDIATVAYWYQDEAVGVPEIPGKEARKPMPHIGAVEIHKWRHEWRKSKGSEPDLWGNE
ncbi:glycoside hydrolase family 172 protein [Anaerophaga thermohalophila]|uniref:glycoside hydrolase family 172 protein n=1 Tax=Anaerophaga thermohalophila TaxID=177400 RepID=UPI000237D35B|nr:glycoside hydrolase family 172 protein [Anaerophaga thermohalophila]